ncbi:GTPase HflX [Candidatus Bathyarchaeota archaeon]|nr:GTPase HflX [Candidatus Bathyarchaeota archaeon]RJS90316.1 MAG: GTPase HflX [Candidatus Bathyarchaeota archaeon]RLI32272.1 MAG: GTPase HflX [Candidatus Bathyarchaeota archaeon]
MGEEKPLGRAVLCMLKTEVHDHIFFRVRMNELRRLVETLGLEVAREFIQTRARPYARYLIGKGKVREIRKFIKKNDIDVVVFYNILKSNQKLNLIRALGCDVIDRYEVILEIFDLMASDTLSKLQIEAARLDKLYPFFKLRASVKYRTERPFLRSMGEYAYHSKLRALRRRMSRIRERIRELRAEKQERIRKRRELGYPMVCIAGYYNAGKTSLFNALTGELKRVSDDPFTTLSSKYQRRYLNESEFFLFIDTIGFVIDLDPRLIKSFELNLEDMRSADVVLLLLEISDPFPLLSMKLRGGIKLLEEIGIDKDRVIVVFNKIDLLDEEQVAERIERLRMEDRGLEWVCISAKKRINLEGLIEAIRDRIREVGIVPQSVTIRAG